MIPKMIISLIVNHVTMGAYVSNSSFRKLAFRRAGSTWPCVTCLCSLWGHVYVLGTILKGLFGCPQELCFASGASNCWSPVSIDFLDDHLDKFFCIGLFYCLLKIHDVTHHFCMKRDRISHTLSKLKVSIVEEVFIHIASSSLRCQMLNNNIKAYNRKMLLDSMSWITMGFGLELLQVLQSYVT